MNDLVILAIAFFVLIQLISGVFNILIAHNLKKIAKAQSQIREEEHILQSAQWEAVTIKFNDIMEKLSVIEEDIFDAYIKSSGVKKTRGPYKPRKPKELSHKKTPPEL